MLEQVMDAVAAIPAGWQVLVLSMLPVSELRGAIPLGVALGLPLWASFLWAILGNWLVIFPLLAALRWTMNILIRLPLFRFLVCRSKRHEAQVHRYGYVGLALLVGVPLPGTGVWTGALVAAVLGLPLLPAWAAITVGMLVAGIVVALVTGGIVAAAEVSMTLVVLVVLLLLLSVLFWKRRSSGRH